MRPFELTVNFANALKNPFGGIELYLAIKDYSSKEISVVSDFVFTRYSTEGTEGAVIPAQPIRFNEASAQQLLDALWNAGIRPSDSLPTEGQLAVLSKHLEDMRSLAFHSLKVTKP